MPSFEEESILADKDVAEGEATEVTLRADGIQSKINGKFMILFEGRRQIKSYRIINSQVM